MAIPLFRARPWISNVAKNIGRIPPGVRIVLSDDAGNGGVLRELARKCRGDSRIRFRIREGVPGWRAHMNELIAESSTELFSFLPQDDRIAPGYYEKLVAALDGNPGAGIAFAPIVAVGHPKPGRRTGFPGPPIELGRRPPWEEAVELDRRWNLGIPFRGVIRRACLQPIPETPDDRFADQIWVFGMALGAHLVEVPAARYLKYYYPGQTHGAWLPLAGEERLAALERQVLLRFGKDAARRAAAGAAVRSRGHGPAESLEGRSPTLTAGGSTGR